MRLGDLDDLKEAIIDRYGHWSRDYKSLWDVLDGVMCIIDNAPTVKTYCYFCGQTEHGKVEENTQGDLISREYLKDAFDNLCCHNCKICRNFRNEDSFYKCALIERAPTVERSKDKISDDYLTGYLQGCKDTRNKFDELQRIQIQISQNKRGEENE